MGHKFLLKEKISKCMYLKYILQEEQATGKRGKVGRRSVRNILRARTAKVILLPCVSLVATVPLLIPTLTLSRSSIGVGRLQASASSIDYYDEGYTRDLTYWRNPASYTSQGTDKASTRITLWPPTESDILITSVCFNGTTINGDTLEYFARIYDYNTNYVISETEWLPANTWSNIFEISYPVGGTPNSSLEIWVRRTDGGSLAPYLLDKTLVTMRANYVRKVPFQTMPEDWFSTTTASVPEIIDTSTTVVSVPDELTTTVAPDTVEEYLTLPAKVHSALLFMLSIVGRLLQLKYVTPAICFGLLVALAGWLLH